LLRIAMLSYHTCPLATLGGKDTGGMNVYVRELTRQLGRIGVHVDVFTRSQDEHVPHVLHDLGYGNRVVHVPAGPEIPLAKRELAEYIPQFAEGIKKFARDKGFQYDLIHSHYWMSGLAAENLSDTWKVPFVHMFHTLGEMKNRVARNDDEREGAYRTDGEKSIIANADLLIAATQAERTQLQFLYKAKKTKIKIIPPGVDRSHFYPIPPDEARAFIGLNPDARIVLFVGRIEPLKGIDTLIQAMSCMKFRQVMEHVHLAIIGGDPDVSKEQMSTEMARLQKLCDELGLEHMVLFLGKRAQETLPYYYSAAEVLVMPSHYESFGMVALEAMACGTPVIASQVGGLAYLVQDGVTGYHVPDQDPEALCGKLLEVLGDQEKRKQMGLQAAEYTREFAWSVIADQMVKIYESLVEKDTMVTPQAQGR
jgi:D-inositol-3-phosphate glycosyltransferase